MAISLHQNVVIFFNKIPYTDPALRLIAVGILIRYEPGGPDIVPDYFPGVINRITVTLHGIHPRRASGRYGRNRRRLVPRDPIHLFDKRIAP